MKDEDVDKMLSNIELPDPGNLRHQQELKIPLLSYKRSSGAGLWLLTVPVIFIVTALLKYELGLLSPVFDIIIGFFKAIDGNWFFTYLIPVIFTGLPLAAMVINFLAFCHFAVINEKKELLVTIKYRPLNIVVFLFSFAVLVYFFLPDKMP